MKTSRRALPRTPPKDYEALCQRYLPRKIHDDGPVSPVELLTFLVEENDVTTRELGVLLGVDHSVAARILKGRRSITPEHAKKLGERFAIRPGRFLGVVIVVRSLDLGDPDFGAVLQAEAPPERPQVKSIMSLAASVPRGHELYR